MKITNFYTILVFILIVTGSAKGQYDSASFPLYHKKINPEAFDNKTFSEIMIKKLNEYRHSQSLEGFLSNDLLFKAADDQATYMANIGEATLENKGKKKTTGDRVILYGGTKVVEEFVTKNNLMDASKKYFTYLELVNDIYEKLLIKKTSVELMKSTKYIFAGVSGVPDYDGKKIYVSVVLGNFKSLGSGAKQREMLSYPYSKKKYGLKPYDVKGCRKCEKFPNIEELQKCLTVEDGKTIYFKYHGNIKDFRKIMRLKKDGLGVDIVQRDQYKCGIDNIVDYNLVNKGVMLKPMYSKKIYKNNLVQTKKLTAVEVVLGEVPDGITGEYELNLLVIQNKKVCKNLYQVYNDAGKSKYATQIEFMPDTVTISSGRYSPKADTAMLSFKIPFQKNKYEFNPSDIQPFLKALKEPDFIINEITLYAYSSIEGNQEENKLLQEKRAQSIIEALKKMQSSDIVSTIITDFNFKDFVKDVQGTKWSYLADMPVEEVIKKVSEKNISTELEPILAKHRYAELMMNVTYDITGPKEQAFVLSKFNKTIKREDLPLAMSIQKYIMDNVIEKKYGSDAATGQEISEKNNLAPFLMNKIFLIKVSKEDELTEDYCEKVDLYSSYAPNNPYITFNKLVCQLRYEEITKGETFTQIQKTIDGLKTSKIPAVLLEDLELELQFKIISSLDTSPTPNPMVIKAYDRIKAMKQLEEMNSETVLELAKLFIEHKDYKFAIKLLEPLIEKSDLSEEFVFTYISLCTHFPNKVLSNRFALALEKASGLNKQRYCNLFKGNKLSFQVLDNTVVKEQYCKTCK